MTSKPLQQHENRKGRAFGRPLQKNETVASADEDEIVESLIETFPASDPPAWIGLTRVGLPKRQRISRPARRTRHP
jgi:hypothetical protein